MPNSEVDGLIFAFSLDGTGGAVDVSPSGSKMEPGAIQWFHYDMNIESTVEYLNGHGLDEDIIQALLSPETRPRVVGKSTGLLLILRGINSNPGQDPEDMVSLRLWIESHRLISVRQRRLVSVQDVRESFRSGDGPRSISEIVKNILSGMTERIATFVDESEEKIETLEKLIQNDEIKSLRASISSLRRQTAVVRRYLAPQREAINSLYRLDDNHLEPEHRLLIRDLGDRLTRYVEDLDLVRERALVVESEIADRISQQLNERMYLFSIIAAIFLPITFITGIFGMNVGGMPGVDQPEAFWLALGGMVIIALLLIMILRMKSWF